MTDRHDISALPQLPAKQAFTPEFRLLAACSWVAPPWLEQMQQDRIAALCSKPVDWDYFLSLVNYHGVQALAYTTLHRHVNACIPEGVRKTLKEWTFQISARSLQHGAELIRLIKLFGARGIDLIPLKGVALSLQLYGEPGTRNSSDLDILIKPDDIDQVHLLLEAEGYQCGLHGTPLTAKQKGHIRTNLYHLEYRHAAKELTLELHWNLGALWLPGHVEKLWSNVTHMAWMDTRITTLGDDALLLFLCDHGARHRYFSLKWLSDVVRLLSCERPQGWTGLIELAAGLDLKRTLAHSALLVHWVYGVPLDKAIQALIREDGYAAMMSRKVIELLLESTANRPSMGKRLGSLRLAWQVLRLRPSLPILKTLKPSLIAAGDFHDFPLPDRLFWLYYPLRPVSWLWRYFLKK